MHLLFLPEISILDGGAVACLLGIGLELLSEIIQEDPIR
jgi:hypothetical protein